MRDAGLANVTFRRADIFGLPFGAAHFDDVFVCFVLEHLADPAGALAALQRVLKPGGSITVIEGDHGSAYFHPDSGPARRAIQCLIDLQRQAGGDALIGRRLYPLLTQAGDRDVRVSPRMVYTDATRPELADGFTRRTFTAMVEGVGEQAVGQGLMDAASWAAGIGDLYRAADEDGTFCYTFFKAVGASVAAMAGGLSGPGPWSRWRARSARGRAQVRCGWWPWTGGPARGNRRSPGRWPRPAAARPSWLSTTSCTGGTSSDGGRGWNARRCGRCCPARPPGSAFATGPVIRWARA